MADAVSGNATATQHHAIFDVINDLCLYMDPALKKRHAALAVMQFACDVEDLKGIAKHIQQPQQARICLYRNKPDEGYVDLHKCF
ncbi:hypothetical protein PSHT_10188 [Puccinia striiformis]|uniref:Uncharacterized protein n=2 Tax=Puccinia striiformis TaxID=27350 RepID=A0A0L0UQU8_9BASI|nr:hypothetical protein KEM48_003016 [Puccinia striiformis f. sp. tritici PST-130]KNE89296.1 hypothetical protein PSTG_17241 [Puccinia striiformis f. sp. tritici PST-78]POW06897.1 hypothetical protein PSHT_10188 [Puccinia striiformis]